MFFFWWYKILSVSAKISTLLEVSLKGHRNIQNDSDFIHKENSLKLSLQAFGDKTRRNSVSIYLRNGDLNHH